LAFKTTENELLESFKKFGTVADSKIIRRGRRSLGYGFVDFVNEDDAKKAVEAMDHKEMDGRPLNVELAKPREQMQHNNNQNANSGTPQHHEDQDDSNTDEGYSQQRGGRRRGGSRGGFRGSSEGGLGGGRGGRGGARGGASSPQNFNGSRPPRTQAPRQPQTEAPPSKTTLFVANLPFSVDNTSLTKIFEGHNVTQARVVITRSGRSRGYGFVTLANEEEQLKALKDLDGKEIPADNGPRKLSIKIAREQEEGQEHEGHEDSNNTNAEHN